MTASLSRLQIPASVSMTAGLETPNNSFEISLCNEYHSADNSAISSELECYSKSYSLRPLIHNTPSMSAGGDNASEALVEITIPPSVSVISKVGFLMYGSFSSISSYRLCLNWKHFVCTNAGHFPISIPSAVVSLGISSFDCIVH